MDGRTLHLLLEELGCVFSDEEGPCGSFDHVAKKEIFNSLNQIAASVYNNEDDDKRKKQREDAVKRRYVDIREACYELEDAADAYATEVLISRYRKESARKGRFPAASYLFNGSVPQSPFRANVQSVQRKLKKILVGLNKDLVDKEVEKNTDGTQIRRDEAAYSFVDKRIVIGRTGDLDAVMKKILDTNNNQEQKGLFRVLRIVGMAGIGKTTLAQLIYQDIKVKSHFNICAWVRISDDFSVIKILKAIIKSSTGTATLNNRLPALVTQLKSNIEGKQLLIVMDDLRDESHLTEIQKYLARLNAKSITILVTTRIKEVKKIPGAIDAHYLQELSTEECWQLLSTIALPGASTYKRKELEAIGRKIVIKCNGLPLAAKHLGDYLKSRNSREEWLDVLNGEMSDLDDFEKGFFPYFGLSNPNNVSPVPVSKQDKIETLPFIDHEVYGRDAELDFLVKKLLENVQHEEGLLHIIPIVGMAGIGKTTLAQVIYNDKLVASHFDARLWVCVSEDFDVERILKEITEDLTGTAATSDLVDILIRSLQEHVKGKRLLLVLDDVRTEDYRQSWNELKGHLSAVAQGSTILATTRTESVAKMMDAAGQVFPLRKLSLEDCCKLFKATAFSGRSEEEYKNLKEIGQKIVAKCNGLPVAVKTLGGYMRFKKTREEWQNVLDGEISNLGGTEEDLLSIFKQSFSHLQPVLKLCLSYCAVFPKGYPIEVDMLIKLWMAQGYLGSNIPGEGEGSNENTEMEKLGHEYLKELQMHSFFQDFRMDDVTCSMTCKINDVVHKFLLKIPMCECFTITVDNFRDAELQSSARHSSLVVVPRSLVPDSITKVKKLRSLLVWSQYAFVTTTCLHDLFLHLRCLRALCFRCCSIEKIPSEIGKMNLLRYLNLSYNRNLKELPKEVCDLYNLQTLNLNGCDNLEKLPEGMEKLTKLRHLEILWTKSLRFLPKGVGTLSSLLTLNRFVISRSSDHNACNLEDLEKLKKLKWYLGIEGLGNVSNVDEARTKSLEEKEGLAGLDLWFSGVQAKEMKCGPVDEVSTVARSEVQIPYKLLEALQPPPGLQYLGVYYYGGTEFPNWMASLTKLRELILFECRKCTRLPCLAELLKLESLEIWEMENVTEIGFDVAESVNKPFPKLEILRIHNMRQWEDWEIIPRKKDDVAAMPSLRSLTIEGCPKLKSLPHHLQNSKVLHELSISGCPNLKQSCQKVIGADWSKISHIPNIKIDGEVVKGDSQHASDIASGSGKVNRQFTRARSQLVKDQFLP